MSVDISILICKMGTLIDMKKNILIPLILLIFLNNMGLGLLVLFKMFVFVDGLYLSDIWFSLESTVFMKMKKLWSGLKNYMVWETLKQLLKL
jgi:hypothetical protein